MNTSKITADQIDILIQISTARYRVALLILLGMLAVALGTLSMALGFRKIGLLFLAIYGGLMSFLGLGLSYIFGPIVVVAAVAGIAREWFYSTGKNPTT